MPVLLERVVDGCEATTGWTALGNDTINLATSNTRVRGSKALTFDKVDGLANTIFAGISKTLVSVDLETTFNPFDEICWYCYVSSVANIAYSFVRLGSAAAHYVEYRYDDSLMVAGFNFCHVRLSAFAATSGTACPFSDVDYIAVGTAHDAETDALAGIIVDHISIHPSSLVISV